MGAVGQHWPFTIEIAVAALQTWLASPGSDVEKALKRAMRMRHSELDQESRKLIAECVLGTAVLRGRLAHILDRELGVGSGAKPELLVGLYAMRESSAGQRIFTNCANGMPNYDANIAESARATLMSLQVAAKAPLFHDTENLSASDRIAIEWSLPEWLAARWVDELGADAAFQLGKAMSLPGRVTLRTNTLKTSRDQLLQTLNGSGVQAEPTKESPWGVWLPDGRPPGGGVWQLPGWSTGLFEVQDEGSQLIALATEACPGEHVLDYCAGRGGKTWALASLVAPSGKVSAWDVDPELRQQLSGARAARAGAADIVSALHERPEVKHFSGPVDVVLVDAPCSSSGALRRHPSQRWALIENDVDQISALQLSILKEAAMLVRPGGRLVYATCSLLRAENEHVAGEFERESDVCFRPWPFATLDGRTTPHYRTLTPHMEGTDGFFMARWQRV